MKADIPDFQLVCVRQDFMLLQMYCESEDEINIFLNPCYIPDIVLHN